MTLRSLRGQIPLLLVGICLFQGLATAKDVQNVKHPKHGLSEAAQRAAAGVASLKRLKGSYGIFLDKDFLKAPVEYKIYADKKADGENISYKALKWETEKKGTVRSVLTQLTIQYGQQIGFSKGRNDDELFLSFSMHAAEAFVPLLQELGHAKRNELLWVDARKKDQTIKQAAAANLKERLAPGGSNCTSFRVGPKYMFTAYHCQSSAFQCQITLVRFNEAISYREGAKGNLIRSLGRLSTFTCKRILIADKELDFTLFEISGEPDSEKFPILPLRGTPAKLAKGESLGEPIDLIGHPANADANQRYNRVMKYGSGTVVSRIDSIKSPVRRFLWEFMNVDQFFRHKKVRLSQEVLKRSGAQTSAPAAGGMSGGPGLDGDALVFGITKYASRKASTGIVTLMSTIFEKHGEKLAEYGIRPTRAQ